MGDDRHDTGIPQIMMVVCLRDGPGKEAVEQPPRAIYPDEAKNAELDITPITAKFKVR
jgi:hypothetical protein